MVIILKHDATEDQIGRAIREMKKLGYQVELSQGIWGRMLIARGGKSELLAEGFDSVEGIDRVIPEFPELEYKKKVSRRIFLDIFTAGSIIVALFGVVSSAFNRLIKLRESITRDDSVFVANLGEMSENSSKAFRLGGELSILVHLSGRYYALSAICTHQGCIVEYDERRQILVCPCHNGVFDLKGNVLEGPPPTPLSSYRVEISGGKIFVKRK